MLRRLDIGAEVAIIHLDIYSRVQRESPFGLHYSHQGGNGLSGAYASKEESARNGEDLTNINLSTHYQASLRRRIFRFTCGDEVSRRIHPHKTVDRLASLSPEGFHAHSHAQEDRRELVHVLASSSLEEFLEGESRDYKLGIISPRVLEFRRRTSIP